jgi:hypothetical protein
MKSVSLIALGSVYLAAPLNLASLAVVAVGFLLNALGARALGSDRTYYGYEVVDLPPQRIIVFPYSWISHPMLIGNIAAFGGTLINADFRRLWWPLACVHIALNLGLLVMEVAVTPQRRGAQSAAKRESGLTDRHPSLQTGFCLVALGAALAALGARGAGDMNDLFAAGIGACVSAYVYALWCCYSAPAILPDKQRETSAEETL